MPIKLKSPSKINIGLKINYKRDDGYHDISSLMQEIDLCDEISLSQNNTGSIVIKSKGIHSPEDQSNLCYIAANLFLNRKR